MRQPSILVVLIVGIWSQLSAFAQVDPISRNQIQLGYDYPVTGTGPQAVYAYYYLNIPELANNTNAALRMAVAPLYFDGELGIRGVITPHTDLGIGLAGGAYGDYYYEVRQGHYFKDQSFDGHGGGAALSLYHLLNPSCLIPINIVARGGFRFSAYRDANDTSDAFELPSDTWNIYTRVGIRVAGKEPVLYSDLGLEVSAWFERQWRVHSDQYGFSNDRSLNAAVNLYWVFANLNYSWTNPGYRLSFAVTAGGSEDADRFSAWRLGGVLPLIAEFPLILPGYYFQEISAKRFVHAQAGFGIPLCRDATWCFRVESAAALVDYLPGFEQDKDWHGGVGCGILYTSPYKVLKVAVRYGYGFNAIRDDREGAHSVGVLLQYDFEAAKKKKRIKESGG